MQLYRICLLTSTCFSILVGALHYRAWMNLTDPANDDKFFSVPYLTIVPSLSITYPWTLLTATLVERNIFSLAVTLATLFYGGKYLERAWGSREFGKFLLIVSVIPNTLAFILYMIWYAVTSDVSKSFATINGAVAIQASFLVAFKQLIPEHTITIFKGVLHMRVKRFPALFLLLITISPIIFSTDVPAVLAWLGFFTSWIYLRFYKRTFPDLGSTQMSSLKGDASETFAIAYFFPEPLYKPVAVVADVVYNLLVTVKICTPFSEEDISLSNSASQSRGPLFTGQPGRGGSSRAEAERRRQLALRALDQQLHAATNKSSAAGPSVLGETSLNTRQ